MSSDSILTWLDLAIMMAAGVPANGPRVLFGRDHGSAGRVRKQLITGCLQSQRIQ
jgi:hypothetical protein